MEASGYTLLILFCLFAFSLVTFRVIIYWRMLKKKTLFDYFIVAAYYIFGIIQIPMRLPDSFFYLAGLLVLSVFLVIFMVELKRMDSNS